MSLSKNKPKITASSLEEFNKLTDVYYHLPNFIQDTVDIIHKPFNVDVCHKLIFNKEDPSRINILNGSVRVIEVLRGCVKVYTKDGLNHYYPFYNKEDIPLVEFIFLNIDGKNI